MFAIPSAVLGAWFRGVLALMVLGLASWLVYTWYDGLPRSKPVERPIVVDQPANAEPRADSESFRQLSSRERMQAWRPSLDWPTAALAGGILLLLWSFAGQWVSPWLLRTKASERAPRLPPDEVRRIVRDDGTELHVEFRGPQDAPILLLTHGWGMTRDEWHYLQPALVQNYRTVVWDLPGLGKSKAPRTRDFSLEKMARDLKSVIEACGRSEVNLVGHSIGGMIMLTLCRDFPGLVEARISRLVLIHTTYVNPLLTTAHSGLARALQKPLIEPLLYLQIALWPLVWVMNWLSYLNGSMHSSTARSGFSGNESRSKLNFVAGFQPQANPAVLARGSLGMLTYDATLALKEIRLPVLVISGAEDPVTVAQASHVIASAVTQGELIELQPAKHYGFLEHDVDASRAIMEFCGHDQVAAAIAQRR